MVVSLSFFRVGQDFVGFLDQEESFCRVFAFGEIRMASSRETTIG